MDPLNEASKGKPCDGIFKNSLCIILSLLGLLSCIKTVDYSRNYAGIDFYQFWIAGKAIEEFHAIDIYSDANRKKIGSFYADRTYSNDFSGRRKNAAEYRRILQTYSTPFLYTVFHWFSSEDYELDLQKYHIICLAWTLFAILSLCKMAGYSLGESLIWIPAFLIYFGPYSADIQAGNVNQIQLGLLALYLCIQSLSDFRYRFFTAGLILGFVCMFKPNVVFVVLLLMISWIFRKRYRKLLLNLCGMAMAAICSVLASSFFFGSFQCWRSWFDALAALPVGIIPTKLLNFSVSRVIYEFSGFNPSAYLTALLLLLSGWAIWKSGDSAKNTSQVPQSFHEEGIVSDFLMVASGCIFGLVTAPLAWFHYFVLSVPALIFLLRPFSPLDRSGMKALTRRRILSAVSFILLSAHPIASIFRIKSVHVIAMSVSMGAFVLYGLLLLELADRTRRYRESGCAPAR